MNAVRAFDQYFHSRNIILIYVSDEFVDIQEWNEITIDFVEFTSDKDDIAETKFFDKTYYFLMFIQWLAAEFFHVT